LLVLADLSSCLTSSARRAGIGSAVAS